MSVPRRSLPPLNAVRAFEAAARLGSFKEAAVELAVTHGAVSQQVRLLEEWLGAPTLFRRSVRRVVLTPAGAALLAEFGPALDRISAAVQQHRARRGDPPAAVLRVNALATFSLRWLLPRMSRFRAEHPDIEVRLSTSNDPVDALPELFDVVIRGGPDSFHGFASRVLLSERRLPVCNPSLLAQLPLAEITDLSRHTLLHVTSTPRLWRDWLTDAGQPSLEPAASLTFDHFYLTIQAALDGLGVAMGPTALIADDLAAGRLVTPFPKISLPARSYFAYFPEGRSDDPHRAVFCDWLEQQGRRMD
ncbi:LysR family transcriptional regulator [Bradyrhizobium sp. 186]|uniref:LysR substrate-binding domain-containing protein n=1 Tax=Bradyrhizobium sp. 186 TaxID=2782654 RepID=UPI002001A430|nr:LysR substrate-binding domain-containing protein [Bradyrhizobium sp. 186]UPK35906.1 LysR family transcriptional regulator [Bradyrhizobium sp. 186]